MGLITKYFNWVDGTGDSGMVNADRLNTNFDKLYDEINGKLNAANLVNPLPLTQTVLLNSGALLKFTETSGGSDYVAIGAPEAVSTSYTLKFPSALGTDGQVMATDASGQLSWVTVLTGTPTDHGTLAGLADDDHTQYSKYAFKTIQVSGQSDVVADTRDDILTFVAGSNITITTNAGADSITIAGSTSIPSGIICMWHGLRSAIPGGWYLCDGTNGTPNLQHKFVRGIENTEDPGTTGGAETHDHDDHTGFGHTNCSVAAHSITNNHAGGAVSAHAGTTQWLADGSDHQAYTAITNHTFTQPTAHSISAHSVTQADAHGSKSHSSESNLPTYYEIAFIMKS